MKKLLLIVSFLLCLIGPSFATGQLGITPCTIAGQPADLSYSSSSANRRMGTCGETVIVWNNTANDVRFRLGSASTTTALTTDLLLPAHTFVTLNVGTSGLYFAVISSGTGTLQFIQGTAGQ